MAALADLAGAPAAVMAAASSVALAAESAARTAQELRQRAQAPELQSRGSALAGHCRAAAAAGTAAAALATGLAAAAGRAPPAVTRCPARCAGCWLRCLSRPAHPLAHETRIAPQAFLLAVAVAVCLQSTTGVNNAHQGDPVQLESLRSHFFCRVEPHNSRPPTSGLGCRQHRDGTTRPEIESQAAV